MNFFQTGLWRVKNMYDCPTHLKGITKPINKSLRQRIETEYGNWITTFEIKRFCHQIRIGISEEQLPLGQIIGEDYRGNVYTLFDQTQHGYNGLLGLVDSDQIEKYKTIELQSKNLIVMFQYSGEEKEYSEEHGGEPSNYFDWISLYSVDGIELTRVFDFECS